MPSVVFLDSDVVISSLISSNGAAYLLIHHTKDVDSYISTFSKIELKRVSKLLNLSLGKLEKLFIETLQTVSIKEVDIQKHIEYVNDTRDAHIITGAVHAHAQFILTYNLKDYKIDDIKEDLNIRILTPALFLQYLRSI